MTRFRSFLGFASLCLVSAITIAARFALDVFAVLAEPFVLRTPAPAGLSLATSAGSISSSLFQRNRHEAGVSRRSAARHV